MVNPANTPSQGFFVILTGLQAPSTLLGMTHNT